MDDNRSYVRFPGSPGGRLTARLNTPPGKLAVRTLLAHCFMRNERRQDRLHRSRYRAGRQPRPRVPRLKPRSMSVRANKPHALAAADLVRNRITALGAQPVGKLPQQLAARIREKFPKWSHVVSEAGIRLD